MEGIPLALVTERSPMLELLVTGNLECTRIVVSVTFLAVGVNTFPKYDSQYHDCHDNFNIFVKTILTKKLWFVKPEISLSVQ